MGHFQKTTTNNYYIQHSALTFLYRNDYERKFNCKWSNQPGNLQTSHIIDEEKLESLKEMCEVPMLAM